MNRWVRAALERVDGRAWLATGVLSLAGFLTNASTFYSLGGVLPAMVHDFHWRWTAAGLGYTILGAACGGSALVPAIIIRRFGVRCDVGGWFDHHGGRLRQPRLDPRILDSISLVAKLCSASATR